MEVILPGRQNYFVANYFAANRFEIKQDLRIPQLSSEEQSLPD